MEKEKINELIAKYNAGITTAEEQSQIETLIGNGLIDLDLLDDLNVLNDRVMKLEMPEPSAELDHRFYQMLSLEKKPRNTFSLKQFFAWPEFAPKLAFASVTLLAGLALGYFIRPTKADNQHIEVLSQQVTDLKEMMMLSLLEKESASDRLKAVSLTQEMDQASQKVTKALLETLNNDSNVNVRLAALDALRGYANDSGVREALVRSIPKQESPLVQVALAELMAGLQVKSSVKELKKIFENENTPADVKNKIKQSIDVLI
jgi:hypothetical protein